MAEEEIADPEQAPTSSVAAPVAGGGCPFLGNISINPPDDPVPGADHVIIHSRKRENSIDLEIMTAEEESSAAEQRPPIIDNFTNENTTYANNQSLDLDDLTLLNNECATDVEQPPPPQHQQRHHVLPVNDEEHQLPVSNITKDTTPDAPTTTAMKKEHTSRLAMSMDNLDYQKHRVSFKNYLDDQREKLRKQTEGDNDDHDYSYQKGPVDRHKTRRRSDHHHPKQRPSLRSSLNRHNQSVSNLMGNAGNASFGDYLAAHSERLSMRRNNCWKML
jgi:hypothetical protein